MKLMNKSNMEKITGGKTCDVIAGATIGSAVTGNFVAALVFGFVWIAACSPSH